MIMFVMGRFIGLRRGMMRICEWWRVFFFLWLDVVALEMEIERRLILGQKGVCVVWRVVALYGGTV